MVSAAGNVDHDALLAALEKEISPQWATWQEPSGGYLVWLKLAQLPLRRSDLPQLLAKNGVQAAFGDSFFLSKTADVHLRLSISQLDETEISDGVRALAAALKELYQKK